MVARVELFQENYLQFRLRVESGTFGSKAFLKASCSAPQAFILVKMASALNRIGKLKKFPKKSLSFGNC